MSKQYPLNSFSHAGRKYADVTCTEINIHQFCACVEKHVYFQLSVKVIWMESEIFL